MTTGNIYQEPMQPWPELRPFGKTIALSSSGVDLFYYEAGLKNPNNIVLIHGLGDEADTWRHVFLPLAEAFHVYALDLPGFGRSQKEKHTYTIGFLETVILGMLDDLKIETPILMGSSLGAIVAHHLALSHPIRFGSLILVGGALNQAEQKLNLSMRLMQIPYLGEWLYTRLRKDPQAAFDTLNGFYHDLNGLPREDRDFLFTRVNKRVWDDGQKYAYFSILRNLTPWVKSTQSNLTNELTTLGLPTLVVRGEYDQLFSEENGVQVAKYQPNAQIRQITDAGHLPHQEKPSDFLVEVSSWYKNFFGDQE